jgi:hypothetical protein
VNLVNLENLRFPLHLARENPLDTLRGADEERSLFVDTGGDARP